MNARLKAVVTSVGCGWSRNCVLWMAAVAVACLSTGPVSGAVDFQREIRPLLSNNCYACHGPDEEARQGGFRLDQKESAFGEADSGLRPIVPGDPQASELYQRLIADDEFLKMPPEDSQKSLKPDEIELIRQWIAEGAVWQSHWAFQTPERPAVPDVKHAEAVRNPIDAFVLRKLEQQGLEPSPQADRTTLIRRVSLDLTGLPPTPEEVDQFLADTSPDAYERLVDRLLRSQRYGEHMARYWLDAARYADTHGLHLDNYREMWPYRDWVVRAFNENKPFDQFVIEQLAGDLLENPTEDQLIATGFNRCHVTTNEGGSIQEEVYVRNVVDRVVTTSTVFMGMTFDCSRCHDHKYDPFTMKDFYSMFAFFNSLDGSAMDGNKAQHAPVIRVLMPAAEATLREIEPQIEDVSRQIRAHRLQAAESEGFTKWQQAAAAGEVSLQAVPDGMIEYFPLDEGDGDTTACAVDSSHTGRVQGTPQWVSGKHGNAFDFDGQTFIDVGDVANFERNQGFSYGAWVKLRQNNGAAILSRMNAGNAHRGYDLYVAGDRVAVHIIHSWNGNAIKVTTRNPLKQGQWQHVFATYDGSGKAAGVTIYFDGVPQEHEVNVDNLTETIRANVSLRIGSRTAGATLNGLVDDVRIFGRALNAEEVKMLAGLEPLQPILALDPQQRSEAQQELLLNAYLQQRDATYEQLSERLAQLRREEAAARSQSGTTLVWKERSEPRQSFVLERGEYDKQREPVERRTPAVLPPMPEGAPNNRLGFAQWLTAPTHPLLSRVTVNRFWQQAFGVGIVKTAEDFGSQGEPPSHPELLDWLAVEFRESGWDVKHIMKRLVMSGTYRQSSHVRPELVQRDPENRLLARGPRFRLDAEVLRDQALYVSGLLVEQLGGPSVKPPQPEGLWFAVGYSGSNTVRFQADEGRSKVHRRTLYTFIKRTAPPPEMSTFDAPSRESTCTRRERTNTPLQALLLLNDPQYVEAARALAERALQEGGETPESRIAFMFRLCTARRPEQPEVEELVGLLHDELAHFGNDPEAARELISIGETQPDDRFEPHRLAAWTIVANLMLNLDEVVTKN